MQIPLSDSPLSRFCEVYEALNLDRRWFQSAAYLRYAALATIFCDGSPQEVARGIRDMADDLKSHAGWFGEMNGEMRFLVSSLLLLHGDNARDFEEECQRVRALFREVGLPRDRTYDYLAILILRTENKLKRISKPLAMRVKQFYEEMKKYHWWLTDSSDVPLCATLSLRDEPVALMAQRIEQIYDGLHREGMSRGGELQASAHLLYFVDERAELAVQRAGELIRHFKTQGYRVASGDYDEVALLSFLNQDHKQIIRQVLAYQDQIRELRPKPDKRLAFSLAATVAFLELEDSKDLLTVTKASLMTNVQAMIAAQRAAAAAI